MSHNYVDVEGGKLYYEVEGDGHALVLIHAGVADLSMWDKQLLDFAERYRVIRYDTRGFGKSQTMEGASFSNRQDLKALLDHLGEKRVYLLGCSRGGQIAIDFTLEFPEYVAALIPIAAGIGGFESTPTDEEEKYFVRLDEVYERGDWSQLAEMEAQLWVVGLRRKLTDVDSWVYERVCEMNYQSMVREDGKGTARVLTPPAVGRLGEIEAPTLVIYGDADTSNTQAAGEKLAAEIKNARKVVFKDTAHMVNMERPQEFNQVVLDFLAEVNAR